MKNKIIRVFILMILMVGLTGCGDSEYRKEYGKKAVHYFATKYSLNEKDIKIVKNTLESGDSLSCLDYCEPGYVIVSYKGKEYKINSIAKKTEKFGDNYQFELIKEDLNRYFSDKIPFANNITFRYLEDDVLRTAAKYDGNIEDYINNKYGVVEDLEYRNTLDVNIFIKANSMEETEMLKNKYNDIIYQSLKDNNIQFDIAYCEENTEYNNGCYFVYRCRRYNNEDYMTCDSYSDRNYR